jgi:hypothetical protein
MQLIEMIQSLMRRLNAVPADSLLGLVSDLDPVREFQPAGVSTSAPLANMVYSGIAGSCRS